MFRNLCEMVDYSIYEALSSKPKTKKNASKIGKGLTQAQITKEVEIKKGLLKLEPSKLKFTLNDLLRVANNRKKFLPSEMGDFRNLRLSRMFPNPASRSISFQGKSDGVDIDNGKERKVSNKYNIAMTFYDMKFALEQDKRHPMKTKTKHGITYYLNRINRGKNPVQIQCSCEDFNWSFSFWDKKVKALLGKVPSKVQNYKIKGTGVPRNPGHFPAMCKHLVKFSGLLRQKGYVN